MNRAKTGIKFIVLLLLIFTASGCVTIYNPATQRNETLLIDTKSEVSLGRDMDRELHKKLKFLNDPLMQSRLDSLGAKIANYSDRQDLFYHFQVVKDPELNAFAIPGGFVYVNSGLIQAANDDELAGVLAHEIGHIAARHSVKKLQAVMGYQLVMNIALGLSGQSTLGRSLDVVFNLVNLGYSRQDEFLADSLAVKYARRADFNPQGIITFFEKLKAESERRGSGFRLAFLSSHPPIEERIKNVQNQIKLTPP
jgi:predicted Zn-dependent protease